MQGHREAEGEPLAAADPIAAVIARIEAIAAPLTPDDGVRRFNELYLAVTREVARNTAADTFQTPEFIARLDVIFADGYFEAIEDDANRRELSKAWAPLFGARHKTGVAPLQFAVAGMNAHINYDLALALIATCKEFAIGLDEGSPQHRDYIVVNELLERVQEAIKERFATGVIAPISHVAPASPGVCCSRARRNDGKARDHRTVTVDPRRVATVWAQVRYGVGARAWRLSVARSPAHDVGGAPQAPDQLTRSGSEATLFAVDAASSRAARISAGGPW
ncbi:hypothetical protein BH20ACT17_BH20ACT17_05080 [soil metagenome]